MTFWPFYTFKAAYSIPSLMAGKGPSCVTPKGTFFVTWRRDANIGDANTTAGVVIQSSTYGANVGSFLEILVTFIFECLKHWSTLNSKINFE